MQVIMSGETIQADPQDNSCCYGCHKEGEGFLVLVDQGPQATGSNGACRAGYGLQVERLSFVVYLHTLCVNKPCKWQAGYSPYFFILL